MDQVCKGNGLPITFRGGGHNLVAHLQSKGVSLLICLVTSIASPLMLRSSSLMSTAGPFGKPFISRYTWRWTVFATL